MPPIPKIQPKTISKSSPSTPSSASPAGRNLQEGEKGKPGSNQSNSGGPSGDDSEEKKFTITESILIMSYIGITDIIGIILVCFALDDFGIIDLLAFPVTQLYFRAKKAKATADLIGGILELVPYVGALPIRSIAVGMTIYAENHPKQVAKATAAVGKVANVASNVPGVVGAAGKAVSIAGKVADTAGKVKTGMGGGGAEDSDYAEAA